MAASPAIADEYNLCYKLEQPIWKPPTFENVIKCVQTIPKCLIAPHCCTPVLCETFPDCVIIEAVMVTEGNWEDITCEFLPVERVLDLFLRGRLHFADNFTPAGLVPGLKGAAFIHVQALRAQAVPIPPSVQNLAKAVIASPLVDGIPWFKRFTEAHVSKAKLLPRSIATAELYLRPGFGAITLDQLVIMNDTDLNTLISAPAFAIPDIRAGGSAPADFVRAFLLLMHELVHVRQYDELGADAFVNDYLLETLNVGYGKDTFEVEAYSFELELQRQLAGSPPGPPSGPGVIPPVEPPEIEPVGVCQAKPFLPQCGGRPE